MTQYAQYDSRAASPSPVIGWYDTGVISYPNLPSTSNLVILTSDQWAARLNGHWAVTGGNLVAYTPPSPTMDTRIEAKALLDKADTTMARVTEAVSLGLTTFTTPDVVAFSAWRKAVRAVVGGSATDTPIPTRPPYPAGTE